MTKTRKMTKKWKKMPPAKAEKYTPFASKKNVKKMLGVLKHIF